MVADWTQMETMNADGDNHADLFGGDLFSDELLDIYNASEGGADSSEHDGVVPLANDMPQILDQNGDGVTMVKDENNDMEYGIGLGSSPSMNEFTSILEGNTPSKPMDSMLLLKNNATPVQQQQQNTGIKRPATATLTNPSKKKVIDNVTSANAAVHKGNAITANVTVSTTTATLPVPIQKNVVVQNNANAAGLTNNNNNTMQTNTTLQNNTMVQKQTPVVNQVKVAAVSPAPVPVAPITQPPAPAINTTYQNTKTTPRLVSSTPKPALPSSKVSVASAKTEESFKGVAQAAVNNLILSAGQNAARYEAGKDNFVKPVDTSTAHVAALTSNNWVAACAASISDAPPGTAEAAQAAALAAASDPAAAKAARARRATLTADERARQNRDRNREHARNTRLRKKAYVEELKRTLTELVTARDASELERRHEKQREMEVREVRYRVMEEFLKLRARGSETNLLARWVAILEDGFSLTIPKTDYRNMVHTQNLMCRHVSATSVNGVDTHVDPTVQLLRGATECFDDASKVATFLQSVATGTIAQVYNCDRKKFMMDGINAVLEWTHTTSMNGDTTPSIILKGCMRATFSPASNKLVSAELVFDSGSIVSQMKSLVSYQDMHLPVNPSSGFSCIAETDALLDSVLPQAPPVQSTKQEGPLPCSVSVVSANLGDTSSDEEGLNQQQQQIKCKQEPSS